jgi:cell wall-associated NlpC family hydrolase
LTDTPLDPRRHAYRDDIAAEGLRGRISALRYVTGELRQVVHAATGLWTRPTPRQGWATQALLGELVTVYDERDGLAWVQLAHDGYVGYVAADALSPDIQAPTHRVAAPGTFRYAAADAKALTGLHLTMNAQVRVVETGSSFSRLADGGFVPTRHLAGIGTFAPDFVTEAERFVGTPYVWGGKTRLGLDCSGLVQTALHAAGIVCPRDSDLQCAEVGAPVEVRSDLAGLQRGDFVFWKGHVGILADPATLLHANAHHMAVTAEPLRGAVDRIASAGAPIMAIKRLI